MTSLGEMLASARVDDAGARYFIPDDWLQGRTTFGGLSAALCLAGTMQLTDGLPPLRSAQIAFIGPAAGDVCVTARVLRQGKSMAFVEADLVHDGRLATRALLAFGGGRDSAIALDRFPMPAVPPPDACKPLWNRGTRISFQNRFDTRLAHGARPVDGDGDGDIAYWYRFVEEDGIPAMVASLAMADGPPPAVMPMFRQPAPISTVTWQVDVLDPDPAGRGWHLVRSTAEVAGGGYAAQTMGLWREDGTPVLAGRQMVALFG